MSSPDKMRPEDISPLRGVMGRVAGSRRREASADQIITASANEVWRLVSDVELIQEWWPRARQGFVADGEEIGREQIVLMSWGRREGRVRQRVELWEPGARYGWRVIAEAIGDKTLPPIADTSVTVEITPQGPLARVEIFARYLPLGPRGALAMRQVVRLARGTFKDALRNVERVLAPGA